MSVIPPTLTDRADHPGNSPVLPSARERRPNGDPAQGEATFRLCLCRTLATSSHELSHVLTIYHGTAFRCLMNGRNHQEERDARPLHLCPVCLRKLGWNLPVEPVSYRTTLKAFCQQYGLDPERDWYERALAALAG